MMIPIASIVINGIGFATRIQINEVNELLQDGVWTKGVVINAQLIHSKTVSYD